MLKQNKNANRSKRRKFETASDNTADRFPGRSHLRLGTITRLRWFAVIGQLATIAFIYWGMGFDFPVGWCLTLVGLSAWLNIVLRLAYPSSYRLIAQYAALILGFDIWHLTALLFLTGGLQNPFSFLLLVPVTISASTQFPRITIQLGVLAIGCATLLAFFHYPLPWFTGEMPGTSDFFTLGQWTAIVIGITFMAFYAWRISRESQDMSRALAAAEMVLAREQRLSALDGLAAAAAHELGTPLSTIMLISKELQNQCAGKSETKQDLELMRSQAQRCQEILATLSRSRVDTDLVHSRMTLTEMLNETAEPHRSFGKGITIKASPLTGTRTLKEQQEPTINRNPGLLYGIGNLVENAVDFAVSQVRITASWDDREVKIVISDDGPGFAMEILDILGEPYVSSRHPPGVENPEERDTGLGLGFFIAKTLLERSGASIDIDNRTPPQTGAVISLVWPRDKIEIENNGWFA